jgi:hypothetical protein
MRELKVGIRIGLKEGIRFFGIEEVNKLIEGGTRVTAILPGNAIMTKLGEDGQNVRLTLSGCDLKVILDDPQIFTGQDE